MKDLPLIMAGRWRVNNDWLIRLKYPNLSVVLVIPMQPSPLIIKPSNKMESLISRKNKMNNLEALLMETGNTIIRIRKDLMGLSLIFLSMWNKARSQKYSRGTITSVSNYRSIQTQFQWNFKRIRIDSGQAMSCTYSDGTQLD